MLFFYLRHGDPIYDPDSLTELGKKQADALAKRLALYGIDEIYSSTSNRAMMTAQPTCDLLHKEMTLLDFTNEKYAYRDLSFVRTDGTRRWICGDPDFRRLFTSPEIVRMGENWVDHPRFAGLPVRSGMERIRKESDKFFMKLGYEHETGLGRFRVIRKNDSRVALFAHGGFGAAFLSCLLDIPYPKFATHFDICHSGMTVINFAEQDGYAIPDILTLSSDSHIYREGLPTAYNNHIRF